MVKYFQNNDQGYLPGVRRPAGPWRNLRLWNIALMIGVTGLFAGYLALNNRAAASGFAVKNVEKRIAGLEDQQRRLDLEMLGRQSMKSVQDQVQTLGFVPVQGIDYLTASGGAVAVK